MMSISKTSYYHKPKKRLGDLQIEEYLRSTAIAHKRWGFDKMMQKLKSDGMPWNHKRVHRIYCELGLNIKVKPRKRIPKGEAKVLLQPISPNYCWSMDFMSDSLADGSKFRTFNVIDDYNREGLLINASISFPTKRVTRLLDEVAIRRGAYPEMIRVDNGPEFASMEFKLWATRHHILIHYIQPGKPAQNAFIERFNRTFREEVLDMNLFHTIQEAHEISISWLKEYNQDRPHEALGGLAPKSFAVKREYFMKSGREKILL